MVKLLGHNKAGKSSLINILTGSIRPTKGSISYFNYVIQSKKI